ncbi:transposase, partial [Neisseria yangbaofengii]|uniref:transposase n=3 Tax=Neisseria yangbaofengii TaxID=2709396 RepID=UPI00197F597C
GVLLPELTEQSVIVMDNARFHRMSVLAEISEKEGHKILALAPYSPELNPIEKAWANIKKHLLKKHLRKVLPEIGNFMAALMSSFYFN